MLAETEGIGSMRGDLIAASIPVKYFAMVKVQGEREWEGKVIPPWQLDSKRPPQTPAETPTHH